MPWPTPQEYNEAIQNPRANCSDPELAAGTPEVTALGLPRPVTGNFASVYRIRYGNRDWAVRCFWREYADMRQRYEAISRYLAALDLPYTVEFHYLERGIRIRGTWYPVLKMQWVDGVILSTWIEQHLNDRAALAEMAERWRTMMAALEHGGVAHGDLQHGNVMVARNELLLVDYDCMFVPALSGKMSHELGHQHYQHPRRAASDFGPGMDDFSAWVIYLSLLALSADPSLWQTMGAGEEHLLFTRQDFIEPDSSAAFDQLRRQGDPALQAGLDILRSLPAAAPLRSPSLGRYAGVDHRADQTFGGRVLRATYRRVLPHPGPAPEAIPAAPSGPEWLSDHLPANRRRNLRPPGFAVRLALTMPLLGIVVLAAAQFAGVTVNAVDDVSAIFLGMCITFATAVVEFHRDPSVRTMRQILTNTRGCEKRLAQAKRQVANAEHRHHDRRNREEKHMAALGARLEAMRTRQTQEKTMTTQRCDEVKLAVAQQTHELEERQRSEVAVALKDLQGSHIRRCLKGSAMWSAPLPGVSRISRMRLWALGIHTAADVRKERMADVKQLGDAVVAHVAAWSVEAELGARRSMPLVLPAQTLERMSARYSGSRASIESRLERAVEQENLRLAEISAHAANEEGPLKLSMDRSQTARSTREEKNHTELRTLRQAVLVAESDLGQTRADLAPFQGVTFSAFLHLLLPPLWR